MKRLPRIFFSSALTLDLTIYMNTFCRNSTVHFRSASSDQVRSNVCASVSELE